MNNPTNINYDLSDLNIASLPIDRDAAYQLYIEENKNIGRFESPSAKTFVIVPSMSGGNLNKMLTSQEEAIEYMTEFVKMFPTVESIFEYQCMYERALRSF